MTNATQASPVLSMQDGRLGLLFGIAVIACTVVAIIPGIGFMANLWGREEYSHVYLILPLALLTFMHRFDHVARGGLRWLGVVFTALAVLTMLVGEVAGLYTIAVYGAVLGLFGLVWGSVGYRGMRDLGGPILYLGFMIPLPKAIYLTLSSQMQLISSKLGVSVMSLLGVSVFLDGNVIDLGTSKLEVAEACNGLRYLFPLISFGYLMAMLLDDALWKKAVLVISTLPIAILMNAGRIAMIGVLVDRFGIGMAQGTQHEVEGFAVFFLCILILLGEVWVLLRIGSRGKFEALDVLVPSRAALEAFARWPLSRAFVVAGGVLAVGALSVVAIPTRAEVIPDRRTLSLFPMEVGPWRGRPQVMESQFLDMLRLTDYVIADYVKPGDDAPVNFYVAYYESQKFGIQSHSPQQCIPGGGWNILSQSLVTIPVADGRTIPANRVVIERQGIRQVAYFWFDERGRSMTDEFQIRYYAIKDSIMRGRSDGALIRLVTPIIDGNEEQADARIRQFVGDVDSSLRAYVPH